MHLFDLLRSDGSIVVNKRLAHMIGLNEALIYSELISMHQYWEQRGQLLDGEWFFCTIENLENNTTLKRGKQDRAISSLIKLGLIESDRKGIPAKRYFKITNKIFEILLSNQIAQNEQTRLSETNKQLCSNRATNNTNNNTNKLNINNNIAPPVNDNENRRVVPFYNWLEERD